MQEKNTVILSSKSYIQNPSGTTKVKEMLTGKHDEIKYSQPALLTTRFNFKQRKSVFLVMHE